MTDQPVIDTDDGYHDDYDRVTVRDIADFLHHHAQTRCGPGGDDPAARAAFLHRKAELFSRIAEQAARTRVDAYVEQVRQLATDARTAAEQADLQLPHQRVGPHQRRTSDHPAHPGGATSEEADPSDRRNARDGWGLRWRGETGLGRGRRSRSVRGLPG